MLCQIFLSPQVKQNAIISNKHGIYELPHKLPKDLRLRILRNQTKSGKSQNVIELQSSAQSSSQNKNFVDTGKKPPKNRN